jgi:hypothetical protein
VSGWVPMPADVWPLVVERLQASGEPWPEEACLFDLRWLHDQRDGRLPGRPALCERWRVTDRTARRLLADTARWWDPKKGAAPTARVQRVSSERPAGVQRASSERPATTRTNADDEPEASSARPADVQPVSSERPADVHTRVEAPSPSPSPSHEEDTLCGASTTATVGETPPALVAPEQPTLVEPASDGAPDWARKAKRPKGVTPLALTGAVSRCLEAIRQRPTLPDRAGSDAKHVLGLWRAQQHPPLDGFVAALELVADWARRSPDKPAARDIRAEGWADGTDRRDSVATICRQDRWGDRLALAEAWDRRGRPTTTAATGPPGARRVAPGEHVDNRTAEQRAEAERLGEEALRDF